ncbi:hypothetical protein IT409_01885 [Candidatus Falkowbacteria bacterium]|nr:hypothetical protein [Candidatus Falkowbacteria bacterium]
MEQQKKNKYILIGLLILLLGGVIGLGVYLYTSYEKITSEVVLPTTQDADELKKAYDELLAYEGVWEGEWSNNIFNNKGTVKVTVDVVEGGVVNALVDLNGRVFGWIDPEAKTYSGTYTKDGVFFAINTDSAYGTVHVNLRPDHTIVIHGAQIPLKRVELVTGSGTFDTTKAEMTYNVDWIGNFGTNGVVTLTKAQ